MPVAGPVPAVYFLSDYGLADEFVGVVHAVLHTRAPTVPVIDLGHEVPPFDVGAGAALLVRCAPFLGPGVVLAVVDPEVGTDRRGVAVETAAGGPSWLVGPDNGLLVPLGVALGGVRRVLALGSAPAGPVGQGVGRTFDGRDVFAPAAAHLVLGSPPDELGTEVDPETLTGPPEPATRNPTRTGTGAGFEAVVTWIDRFGNVQLGAGPEALEGTDAVSEGRLRVRLLGAASSRSETARWVTSFADLAADELGLLVDSTGHLALVRSRASAADYLGPLSVGDALRLGPDPADHQAG